MADGHFGSYLFGKICVDFMVCVAGDCNGNKNVIDLWENILNLSKIIVGVIRKRSLHLKN